MAKNMFDLGKDNDSKKNDLNPEKFKTKPSKKNNEYKTNDSKGNQTFKTMRVSFTTYSVLDTWRRVMSDDNNHFSFNDVIKSMNNNFLNSLSGKQKEKFKRLNRRVELENKSNDDDFTL